MTKVSEDHGASSPPEDGKSNCSEWAWLLLCYDTSSNLPTETETNKEENKTKIKASDKNEMNERTVGS